MSTISVTNINDGDSVTAASVNNQINTIVNDYDGNITDANISASAAISAGKLAGGVAGMFGAWTSYTPTFANTTLGNGTVAGKYVQFGKTVLFKAEFTLGSTSAVASNPTVTLPVTSVTYLTQYPVAQVTYYDASATTGYSGFLAWNSTTIGTLRSNSVSGSNIFGSGLSSTTPITWAVSDQITVLGFYEAA